MSLQELQAIQNEFGLSETDIAEHSLVHVDVVREWLKSSAPAMTPYQAYNLRSFRYGRHVEAALAASGILECPVQTAFEKRVDVTPITDISSAEIEAHGQHRKSCEICIARDQCVVAYAGEPPKEPESWWQRIFTGVYARVSRLPEWARPAAWGALFLFVLTYVRIVFLLPRIFAQKVPLDFTFNLIGASFVAAGGGAMGGLAYWFIAKPFLRVPVAGPYITGVITVVAYMGSIALAMTIAGENLIESWEDVPVFLLISAFFGLVVGWSFFKDHVIAGNGRAKPVANR